MHILIIDDAPSIYAGIKIRLNGANVLFATTHLSATNLIQSNHSFDFIVIDGCIAGRDYDTEPLIKLAREHQSQATLIAASSYPHIREQMVEDGCSLPLEKVDVRSYLEHQMQQPVA